MQNVNYVEELQRHLSQFSGVVLIITGDEANDFPIERLQHENMIIWQATPKPGVPHPHVNRFIGCGTTPHMTKLPKERPEKDLGYYFAGQVTHTRRFQCVSELRNLPGGELLETAGFTQGLAPEEYVAKMARARVVPCPSGPETPDTFRVFEALESGAIPIVDALSPSSDKTGYWQMLFGMDPPFPIIEDWSTLPGLIEYYNDVYTAKSNEVFAWWQQYKRDLKWALIDDYGKISGEDVEMRDDITVVVPTSPVLSNPDTSIIEETVGTVRAHLPTAEIIITFDGVREEQEHLRAKYDEYISRVLWKANKEWWNVVPVVYKEHKHQVGMMRGIMGMIKTDKILYVEHDTPITADRDIDWVGCRALIDSRDADLLRFHFEAFIPKVHEYLMLDKEPISMCGIDVVRTIQWSQRPHLTTKEYYERILRDHFTPEAVTFIEDKMHSVVATAYNLEQNQGWMKHKLWIYHPPGDIKRSYHTDGRGEESKYDMTF
jgi:hypothetical protein